ncbi:MAG: nicotinate phosphoribosyltransferase [Candidatus Latescibacteria bacterium]|nr:nicotinate phosphoribosyltransferase [Candidatus Latescibacterota bacterium]
MKESDRQTAEGILFTDHYQLTMAQLYFRMGLHEKKAQFNHFFRRYPEYGGQTAGYCVNAGLEWLLDWMAEARFRDQDIEHLRGQTGRDGSAIFQDDFLDWLRGRDVMEGLSLRAIPEGRVVHPNVPLVVVEGPLVAAQILESALLNHLNYPILIATKAARMRASAHGASLLEFGLRRAHGSGANAGTRAALIGGADLSSNAGISHVLGYPPRGTHGHSMVQVFMALGENELSAFRAYADVYPDDCLLLVDTVDTLASGIPNAIRVFDELRRKGHEPLGIRLDSGDLAYLSIQAARMLDDAGYPDAIIVLSNELDEFVIWQITEQIRQEAPRAGVDANRTIGRLVYGVGTRLITSAGDASLGGVYKLVAVHNGSEWAPAVKISDSPEKVPNPGDKRVWRLYGKDGYAVADLLGLSNECPTEGDPIVLHHPDRPETRRTLASGDLTEVEPLLVDILDDGRLVCESPSIEQMREAREADLDRLHPGVRRLINPHLYHVSLTTGLRKLKTDLIRSTSAGTLDWGARGSHLR